MLQGNGRHECCDSPDRIPFTRRDFARICEMIHRSAGISLGQGKQEMVYSRLARRLRARRLASFAEYLQILESGDKEEWEAFINALTTNLTCFFRESHHFPLLSDHLRKSSGKGTLLIWSCAASTGEEPYSIAMTAAELFGTFSAPVRIIATDIDTKVLAAAQLGVYPLDQIKKLEPQRLKRFFLRGTGRNSGFARVRPELQQMVAFSQLNLRESPWQITQKLDAIFCRNVMIYFDKETQYGILQRFVPMLKPGGLLFTGHSENFCHASDLFRPCGKTVYEVRHGK